jgi:glycerophosphoryl diester phosphodiesterase
MTFCESFTQAKSAALPSEDGLAASAYYAAVIDGATSARPASAHSGSARPTSGETPGRMAMETLQQCISGFPPGLTLRQAADWMTEAVRSLWELFQAEGAAPNQRPTPCPTASVVIYSVARREVWQIGDCPFLLDDVEHRGAKAVDALLSAWRARTVRRLLAKGMTQEALLQNDPGRAAILPYLQRQQRLQNVEPALQRRAYGVVDGQPIPEAFLRVYPLSPGRHELVLASDGYPRLFPTLAETEAHLMELLRQDPLCIGPLIGTKGLRPGQDSFDDRTYLKLQID